MTYLFVPDDDSEFGPIWEEGEARENFTAEELSEAKPAELIVLREGSLGHYLAATYLDDAADVVESTWQSDYWTPSAREGIARQVEEWRRVAAVYNEHGGAFCPGAEEITLRAADGSETTAPGMCRDCEFIHEDTDKAENVLSELGYVTTWNDGFTIHKVAEENDG